jgi:hypothetical protein
MKKQGFHAADVYRVSGEAAFTRFGVCFVLDPKKHPV